MKNNKGITLIALVVTIIVLLILAGISIAMLTGDNGILTNASKTSTENAYYGAEEQVKLAFMAVKTEIMAQTVKKGTYDPTDSANVTALAKIVSDDLKDSKWSVTTDSNKIRIKYTDSKIDKDILGKKDFFDTTYSYTAETGVKSSATNKTAANKDFPTQEGHVNYTITLYNQNIQEATLECDLSDSYNRTY